MTKQLTIGEPVEVRLPSGSTRTLYVKSVDESGVKFSETPPLKLGEVYQDRHGEIYIVGRETRIGRKLKLWKPGYPGGAVFADLAHWAREVGELKPLLTAAGDELSGYTTPKEA